MIKLNGMISNHEDPFAFLCTFNFGGKMALLAAETSILQFLILLCTPPVPLESPLPFPKPNTLPRPSAFVQTPCQETFQGLVMSD